MLALFGPSNSRESARRPTTASARDTRKSLVLISRKVRPLRALRGAPVACSGSVKRGCASLVRLGLAMRRAGVGGEGGALDRIRNRVGLPRSPPGHRRLHHFLRIMNMCHLYMFSHTLRCRLHLLSCAAAPATPPRSLLLSCCRFLCRLRRRPRFPPNPPACARSRLTAHRLQLLLAAVCTLHRTSGNSSTACVGRSAPLAGPTNPTVQGAAVLLLPSELGLQPQHSKKGFLPTPSHRRPRSGRQTPAGRKKRQQRYGLLRDHHTV